MNKYKFLRIQREARKFKKEHRKEIRLLVVLTLSFTIAFTWRQTLFDLSQTFVQFITNIEGSVTSTILTSTFITIISILLIRVTSHILKENKEN